MTSTLHMKLIVRFSNGFVYMLLPLKVGKEACREVSIRY